MAGSAAGIRSVVSVRLVRSGDTTNVADGLQQLPAVSRARSVLRRFLTCHDLGRGVFFYRRWREQDIWAGFVSGVDFVDVCPCAESGDGWLVCRSGERERDGYVVLCTVAQLVGLYVVLLWNGMSSNAWQSHVIPRFMGGFPCMDAWLPGFVKAVFWCCGKSGVMSASEAYSRGEESCERNWMATALDTRKASLPTDGNNALTELQVTKHAGSVQKGFALTAGVLVTAAVQSTLEKSALTRVSSA